MGTGRPSTYTQDKAFRVCDLLQDGTEAKSMSEACRIVGVAPGTFLGWVKDHPELAERYARADEIATEQDFVEFARLNDEQPPKVKGRVDIGWVQWQRMRLDNKKWEYGRRHQRKFGDKVTVAGDKDNPIQINVSRDDLLQRLLPGNRAELDDGKTIDGE